MSKFWPSNSNPDYPHWEHLEKCGDNVFHRAIGDIPGCTPAPREGIFRPIDSGTAWKENHRRADKYCAAVQGWIDGNDFGTTDIGQRWQAMWRASGHSEPIYGAYGEKL